MEKPSALFRLEMCSYIFRSSIAEKVVQMFSQILDILDRRERQGKKEAGEWERQLRGVGRVKVRGR